MKRRDFISVLATAGSFSAINSTLARDNMIQPIGSDTILVDSANANFVREPLRFPFGFKGGYLTELWQSVVQLQSASNKVCAGATQSTLYGDADLFSAHTEAGANALMFAVTERAMQLVKKVPFQNPIQLLDSVYSKLLKDAKRITGRPDLNTNFVLNALVAVDTAAWSLYAAENKINDFATMIPALYKNAFAAQNSRIGVLFQVSYNMPVEDIVSAVDRGIFLIKIKTGQPGTQEQMLEKDINRITQIHNVLKNKRTSQTRQQIIYYTLDSNGRYENKKTLKTLLAHIDKIGASPHLLLVEEPFPENNNESVHDLNVRIAADESANSVANVTKRIQQGYKAIVLKAVARTLSLTIQIAQTAKAAGVPCFCSDLTVNPFLLNWHKNVAARLEPFPELGMALMETNGKENYRNWKRMCDSLPYPNASWQEIDNGVYNLDDLFYMDGAGIFKHSVWYDAVLNGTVTSL